jgi:hypothetical protein
MVCKSCHTNIDNIPIVKENLNKIENKYNIIKSVNKLTIYLLKALILIIISLLFKYINGNILSNKIIINFYKKFI